MAVIKREGELKSEFTKEMSRALPSFIVQLFASAGAPDRLIAGYGRMTTWEFKHATPDFESIGLQELSCMRLAQAGHCRYVLWSEKSNGTEKRTLIVHPKHIYDKSLIHEKACTGFDHRWLVDQVWKAHTE